MHYGYGCNTGVASSAFRRQTMNTTTIFPDGQVVTERNFADNADHAERVVIIDRRSSGKVRRMMAKKKKAKGEQWLEHLVPRDGGSSGFFQCNTKNRKHHVFDTRPNAITEYLEMMSPSKKKLTNPETKTTTPPRYPSTPDAMTTTPRHNAATTTTRTSPISERRRHPHSHAKIKEREGTARLIARHGSPMMVVVDGGQQRRLLLMESSPPKKKKVCIESAVPSGDDDDNTDAAAAPTSRAHNTHLVSPGSAAACIWFWWLPSVVFRRHRRRIIQQEYLNTPTPSEAWEAAAAVARAAL